MASPPVSPAEQEALQPTGAMATEPAMTIGQLFANKVLLANAIAAAIALISLTGFAIPASWDSNEIAANISTIVPVISVIFMTINTYVRQLKQAKVTREAVYSPAKVSALTAESAATGVPVVSAPPADDVLGTDFAQRRLAKRG